VPPGKAFELNLWIRVDWNGQRGQEKGQKRGKGKLKSAHALKLRIAKSCKSLLPAESQRIGSGTMDTLLNTLGRQSKMR